MIPEITLGLVLLNCILTLWALRIIVLELQEGLSTLDSMLASAIQKVIEEGGLGNFEPINPIQKALAEMLTSRITQGSQTADLTRGTDGKFVPVSGNIDQLREL